MIDRRRFLISSASAATLAACSAPSTTALAPKALLNNDLSRRAARQVTRLEVSEFARDASMVRAFRKAVIAMKADPNARHVLSWSYWHFSHWMSKEHPPHDMARVWNQCRHRKPYFFAWHRGFLRYFELIVREISGHPNFALPYWDYYKNPKLPQIFAKPTLADGSANPLFWSNRASNVVKGLSYTPFGPAITTFPWGPADSFEDLTERNPHGHVHDQVGGSMGNVPTAPADPVFWVHHCNVDRYWSAWLAAGAGRHMPPAGDSWWNQTFYYDLDRSWKAPVRSMVDTRNLGYTYDDESLPVAPPDALLPARPPSAYLAGENGTGPIALRLEPFAIDIPIEASRAHARSLALQLDGIRLTEAGRRGGYSFAIYANLPEGRVPLAREAQYSIGEFGPFELSMPMPGMTASSSAGTMQRFPLAAVLERQGARASTVRISIVPVTDLPPSTDVGSIARLTLTS
jgi:tyrosinase